MQEFPCRPWSFAEMQRCPRYTICNYDFVGGSETVVLFTAAVVAPFLLISNFHGRTRQHFVDGPGLCEKHCDTADAMLQPVFRGWGGVAVFRGGIEVFIYDPGLIAGDSSLGLLFWKLSLLHGLIQLSVVTAYFFLYDKYFKAFSQPF
jgi:hypothetical protein